MRLLLKGLAFCAALSLSSGASAAEETHQYIECTREPSEADLTAAKAAFQAGNVSFNEADYPRAILYWEDAFRRDCTANPLLLNLARAYELSGQKRQAVIALETFLQREPTTPERAQISRRIEVLKKQIDAEPPPVVATTPLPATPAPAQPGNESAPAEPAASSGPSTTMRVLPWVVVGVGGVVTLTGILIYADAHKDVQAAKDACGGNTDDCPPEVVGPGNEASRRETTGSVIAVSGLVVLGGGLLWYALTPKSTKTAVAPVLAPGYAGLHIDGRF